MINGIIIATFSALREEGEKKDEDKKNICYICSLKRVKFETSKVDFDFHCKNEHNYQNYVKYLIILKMTDEREHNSEQYYINNCLKKKDISFFPIYRAKSLGGKMVVDNEDEDEDSQ